MRVGTGKSEMRFPADYFPAEGFSKQYGSLYARTAILCDDTVMAILSLEMTSLPDEEIDELKSILSDVTGIEQKNCFICVTHTFSAPHILPDGALTTDEARNKKAMLKSAIHTAARESAAAAKANIGEARLKLGHSECRVNINRDIETKDGWWVSNCGTAPSDKTLTVICAETEPARNLSLILVHYAIQSSVLDGSIFNDGGKAVSGDIAGMMCKELEEHYPGVTAIFLLGAAGDQAPIEKAKTLLPDSDGNFTERDAGEEGLRMCRKLGFSMAESAREAIRLALPLTETGIDLASVDFTVPAQKMPPLRELRPTRYYKYVPDGEKQVRAESLRIGPIALLCVKPELNCATARKIEEASDFDATLVTTMVNGGAKYMADAGSYDRFTYEAMNSQFGKGAAEILSGQAAGLLAALYTAYRL